MKRAVQWTRPVKGTGAKVTRTSKCGRYRVVTRWMSSGRNGYFNTPAYEAQQSDGRRIGRELHDTLRDAQDAVEQDNNPDWEPD